MKFLDKMERKFGRYAIRNLTMYIIGMYVIGYMLELFAPNIIYYLNLEPAMILKGQIWRLVSWVFIPPEELDLFTIIMLFLYLSLGNSLERAWGSFRYNIYIFMGIVFSIAGAFLLYFCGVDVLGFAFSTYYINMSIFLAFTALYPNQQLLFMFVIPIKIKWFGILYGVMIVLQMVQGTWAQRVVILASLANFVVYFLMTRNTQRIAPKEIRRKQNFRREIKHGTPTGVTKHKCAICGRTELDGEFLEFRFCSKCEGNYEYCQDHLFTHEHVHRQ